MRTLAQRVLVAILAAGPLGTALAASDPGNPSLNERASPPAEAPAEVSGPTAAPAGYATRNVIIAVMDGVRYSETFGDERRALIPNLAHLAAEGTLYTNFHNMGVTITRPGHSTIATGTRQTVPNGGPRQTMPTIFEYARNELGWSPTDCWAIFGKGPYAYACYSSFPGYGRRFAPRFVCDIGEMAPEDDTKVLQKVVEAMATDRPRLLLVNFGVTDETGHTGNWDLHTEAIRHCDRVLADLWRHVQSTPGYRDATTVFLTNDHGRHNNRPLESHQGFREHGDACEGCRHVMMLVLGPDVKRGAVIGRRAFLVDIAPTVGELLGFQTPLAEGKILADCFAAEPLRRNRKEARTPEAERAVHLKALRARDPLHAVAEATLARRPGDLPPSPGTEVLMRGMLRAAEAAKDARYRQFVQAWAWRHARQGPANPHVARVLLDLAADGKPAAYLAAGRQCALTCAAAPTAPSTRPADQVAAALLVSLVARAAEVTGDRDLALRAKALLGLADTTEAALRDAWRVRHITPPPMACDFGREFVMPSSVSQAEVLRCLALADAVAALPNDRVVRLARNVGLAGCARGLREKGGVWDDPTVSALILSQVAVARRVGAMRPERIHGSAAPYLEIHKPTRLPSPGPLPPPYLDRFYPPASPYSRERLRYEIDAAGHYGDGTPLADGAALLLFAETILSAPPVKVRPPAPPATPTSREAPPRAPAERAPPAPPPTPGKPRG